MRYCSLERSSTHKQCSWFLNARMQMRIARIVVEVVAVALALCSCTSDAPSSIPTKNATAKSWKESYDAGSNAFVCRNYTEAAAQCREALTSLESAGTKGKVDAAVVEEVRARLALSLAKLDKISEAQPYTDQVIKFLTENRLNDEASEILVTADQLSDEYVRSASDGATNEDARVLDCALKLHELSHVGFGSTREIDVLTKLALAKIHAGKIQEAKKYYMRLADGVRKRTANYTHGVVSLLKVYVALDKANEKKESETIFQVVDESYKITFGSLRMAMIYDRLGSAYRDSGDVEKSIKYLKLGLEEQNAHGGDNLGKARATLNLAHAYEKGGDQAKADKAFLEAIHFMTGATMRDEDRADAFDLVNNYVQYLKRQKRSADAAKWTAKGEALIRNLIPE